MTNAFFGYQALAGAFFLQRRPGVHFCEVLCMLRMMQNRGGLVLELAGWLVFTASSCGFLVSTYMARDIFAFGGSLLFLLGCLMFMVPLALRVLFGTRGGHGPLAAHDACKEAHCKNSARDS